MIPDSIVSWHHTVSDYHHIRCHPDAVYRLRSSKERCTEILPCVVANSLYQLQILQVCQSLSNTLAIYVFVHVHADYEPVAFFSPCSQLRQEIVFEACPWARAILFCCDKVSPLLLITGSRRLLSAVAWIITTQEQSDNSI